MAQQAPTSDTNETLPIWVTNGTAKALLPLLFEVFGSDNDVLPDVATDDVQQLAHWFSKLYPYGVGNLSGDEGPTVRSKLTPYADAFNRLLINIPVHQEYPAKGTGVADAVILCGGQSLTIAQHVYSLQCLRSDERVRCGVTTCFATHHVYFRYPTLEQYQAALTLVLPLSYRTDTTLPSEIPRKFATDLIEHAWPTSDVTFLPFRKVYDTAVELKSLLSIHCPDKALDVLFVCVQPEQAELALREVFRNTAHTVQVVSYISPELEEVQQRYWNDTPAHTAAFKLCDVMKILRDLAAMPPRCT